MASTPVTTLTRIITRDKLAKFLPNQEAIKAFENLAFDVGQTLPDATNSISATAQLALDAAESAQVTANAAQLAADQALAQNGELLMQPDITSLHAELAKLRDRVAALEQGTNP